MKGKLQIETVSSLVLKDNPLGDPRRREIPVYLPPSYGLERGRRYPVLYYLPGFTGTGRGAVNYNPWKENIVERFDRLIESRQAREAILVIPDGFTAFGGSQYLNSSATGRYADHLVAEIVPFIQDKFAVMDQAAGRAIFGTSSGGFGALTLGMRYPNTFGHVVSHSGDMGFDTCYQADFLKLCVTLQRYPRGLGQFLEEFRRARDKSAYDHSALNAVAMAACYTPNPKSPWGFDLPVDTHTGEMIPSVWKRWQALDPVTACEKYSSGLSQLKTLRFDAGSRDEFYLHLGARRLARRLKALSIRHEYEEHGLGHFNLGERLDLTLALLTKRCKSRL